MAFFLLPSGFTRQAGHPDMDQEVWLNPAEILSLEIARVSADGNYRCEIRTKTGPVYMSRLGSRSAVQRVCASVRHFAAAALAEELVPVAARPYDGTTDLYEVETAEDSSISHPGFFASPTGRVSSGDPPSQALPPIRHRPLDLPPRDPS